MGRMWTVGAVVLMCLALGGLPAVAQEATSSPGVASSADAVVRFGLENCQTTREGPTMVEGGVVHWNGDHSCDWKADDPRISGVYTDQQYCDVVPDGTGGLLGIACWGAVETVGPEGTWVGFHVTSEPSGGPKSMVLVMEGTAAYEGWTFVANIQFGDDMTPVAAGHIYQGPPPTPWVALLSSPEPAK